jgi:hypothetical protein
VKLTDIGFRPQRWWNEGVVHGWFLDQVDGELGHVTFCGILILINKVDLYGEAPVTCLACMGNGALEQ